MSEAKWIAIPGRLRWNTRERPLFEDGLWEIHQEGVEQLPIAVVDRGDDHDPPTRKRAAERAAFIVLAVNSHNKLVEAPKACEEAMTREDFGTIMLLPRVRAALREAEGRS